MDISGSKRTIAIIGSGHIATALVEGLIRFSRVSPQRITVSNPSGSNLQEIKERFGVKTVRNNRIATEASDWVFVAVRPAVVQSVIREIRDLLDGKLLISLAAIVRLSLIRQWARPSRPACVRMMPNMSIAVGEGVIGLCAGASVTENEKRALSQTLASMGLVVDLHDQENRFDLLTIISGCGPALVASWMNDITVYGCIRGLSLRQSRNIAMRLFRGTIEYMEQRTIHPEQLIASVATKGGITETILRSFERHQIQESFFKSLDDGLVKLENQRTS